MKRLQNINGDMVLEITDNRPFKVRYSEKMLLRQIAYLEAAIVSFETRLARARENLNQLYAERDKAQ